MMSFFFFFWHFVYFRKNVPVELALSLCFPQIASTSSVESMPGADGSGAFGGVSNSKLILVVEQAGLCSFCSRKESEVLQYLSLCSTVCCCSSAVLNFLSGLESQLLAGFASPVSVNPPSPGMCGTNGEPRSREADCYLCRVLVCFSVLIRSCTEGLCGGEQRETRIPDWLVLSYYVTQNLYSRTKL